MADANLSDKTLKELVRLGVLSGEPKEVGGVPYAIVPTDCNLVDLSKFKYNDFSAQPHRKKATVAVLDAASFIEYYQKFSDDFSRVFADETRSLVLAVLDYHGAGPEGAPRWGQHRITLTLRKSPEWLTWTAHNGQAKKMTQAEFAEFVEDNSPDFRDPKAATMLEMARTLEAKSEVEFSSALRASNGNVQLTYNEQIKGVFGVGKVEIPEQFTIGVPVYVGSPRVDLTARLRYRLATGKLSIWYDLLRADEVERNAFTAQRNQIAETLAVTIINGTPAGGN